jgi:tetratricopeptide (TPR) repeat protein
MFKESEYNKFLEKQKQKAAAANTLEVPEQNPFPGKTAKEYEQSGDNHFRSKNIDMAYVQYSKALNAETEKNSFNTDLATALVLDAGKAGLRYKIGRLFLYRDLHEEAGKMFKEILKEDQNNSLAYEGLGIVSLERGDFKGAEEHFRHAITLNPREWHAHNYLGVTYDRQKKFYDAITEYKAAIALKPDVGMLFNNLGISYYLAGEHAKAANAFAEAIEKGYKSSTTYNNLALVLSKLGRYDEAVKAFQQAGDSASAYNNIGYVYLTEGKYQEAIEAFEKALEVNPTFYSRAHENLKKARQAVQQ